MSVYHIAAECAPFVKAGGLADVVGALPKSLRSRDVEASVIIPCYAHLHDRVRGAAPVLRAGVTYDGELLQVAVYRLKQDEAGFPIYTVYEPVHFGRPGIYQDAETGLDFENQGDRFLVFQMGVLAFLEERDVSLLHLHDHHTGLIPYLARQSGRYDSLRHAAIVYTVHSAEHQGKYPKQLWRKLGLGADPPAEVLFRGEINSMKAGIVGSDAVTTVSPGYAAELVEDGTAASGLLPVFRSAAPKLHGILNGIDHEVWHPARDTKIPHRYSADDLSGKAACKRALCDAFGLDASRPLLTFIGRLMDEKGMQILPDAIERLLDERTDVSIFILGTGYPHYEQRLLSVAGKHGNRGGINATLVVRLEFNDSLAHQLYASSDFLLMPSRVEPCGLNQLYALAYGAIPVVHAVGGLRDTVEEWDPALATGNGFVFHSFDADAFLEAIRRALATFAVPDELAALRKNGMEADWSWQTSAGRYIDLYTSVLEAKPLTNHPEP